MRRVAIFMVASLFGVVAVGQGLLDCIEPDVLRALLLQSRGEQPPIITAAMPAELSALKMPREFTWIGSAERITGRVDATTNASQVTAAWRTNLAPDAARAAATTALTNSGWEVRTMPGVNMSVFSSAAMPVSQTVCRDGKPFEVNANLMDGITYLMLVVRRGNNDSICNQPERPFGISNSPMQQYMPHLEMPVDPATGAAARTQGTGLGYSGGMVNARTEFSIADSAGNIARHFSKQMAEQGWSSDASWSGASTAGSSWSKRANGDTLIQSTLSVTAVDDRQFIAVLRLSPLK